MPCRPPSQPSSAITRTPGHRSAVGMQPPSSRLLENVLQLSGDCPLGPPRPGSSSSLAAGQFPAAAALHCSRRGMSQGVPCQAVGLAARRRAPLPAACMQCSHQPPGGLCACWGTKQAPTLSSVSLSAACARLAARTLRRRRRLLELLLRTRCMLVLPRSPCTSLRDRLRWLLLTWRHHQPLCVRAADGWPP